MIRTVTVWSLWKTIVPIHDSMSANVAESAVNAFGG
jgi:hypothetical protein